MAETKVIEVNGKKTKYHEFGSLNEFYDYIVKMPLNDIFRWEKLSSVNGGESFTMTKSFEEATDIFKSGWSDMAKKLEKRLSVQAKDIKVQTTRKARYDVTGFQASVPRYLQGIPTNMVNQKTVVQKQKVITLNKDVSYSSSVRIEDIVDSSTKALQIVKEIESRGIRVNLNLLFGTESDGERILIKIRIKSANERMNVSKVAFPLVHPSMLRRLFFRYIEVSPNVTKKDFKYGYGTPFEEADLKIKNETLLPRIIKNVEDIVKKTI